jgi:hypothetical protein
VKFQAQVDRLFAALLVMPQAHDPRIYEDKSHHNINDPAQPLVHWLFVWPGPADESSVKRVGTKPRYDHYDSHDYLNYPRCHSCYLLEPQTRALPTVAYPPTPPAMFPLPASPYAPKFVVFGVTAVTHLIDAGNKLGNAS